MTKVDDAPEARLERPANPVPKPARKPPFIIEFYRSAIAKKWLMAITGIMLMGFVFAHMIGNLKMYLGADDLNHYAEWLREMGEPALPRTVLLWIMRVGLIGAFAVHIISAAQLTRMNHKARPDKYKSPRDYAAANFASRTMRWTGVIVGLFLIFHLLDLTWGQTGADFTRGDVYDNVIASFERVPVAIVYILANIALGIHLYHGSWSMFQSLGWNNRKFNDWRRLFAIGFAGIIVIGNVSMPLLVVTGVVS
ncbi:MAG: succinate dehydrogenase cytochrome b subunit [Acidimicrobiia bacterium]|jgi:succinate dehydrogenase / fumarate reductase cytochrome b subunit